MSYKLQFFIDEVLQCLVDKYQITYQINMGGMHGQTSFNGIQLSLNFGATERCANVTPLFTQKYFE